MSILVGLKNRGLLALQRDFESRGKHQAISREIELGGFFFGRGLFTLFSGTALADVDGKAVYEKSCAACHGPDGRGNTPTGKALKIMDLGTKHWASPEAVPEIVKAVGDGVPRMPGMASKLKAEEIEAAIDEALDRIYALGPFESVDYVYEESEGQTGLVVRAVDRVPDAGRVRLGLIVENDFNTESDAAVSVDFRSAALDSYGSEIQARATIGDFNEIAGEYFRFLDPSQNWFTAVRGEIQNRPVNLYSQRSFKAAGFDLTYGLAALDGGYQFGNVGEVRLGVELGTGRAKLNEGFAPFAEFDVDIGRLVATGAYDTLDDPFLPRDGLRAGARWVQGLTAIGDNTDFQTISGSVLSANSHGPNTLIGALAAGQSLNGAPPLDALYRVGGLFSLSGYRKQELADENFLTAQLIYRRQLLGDSQQIFGVPLFVGGSVEFGDVWPGGTGVDAGDVSFGSSAFVAASTAFGPVYLAFGRSEGGRQSAYLLIGRTF